MRTTLLFLLTQAFLSAQPDYTKKEHVQCAVCHDGSWTSGKYTEAGKYYMEHHTFQGYHPSKPAPSKSGASAGH